MVDWNTDKVKIIVKWLDLFVKQDIHKQQVSADTKELQISKNIGRQKILLNKSKMPDKREFDHNNATGDTPIHQSISPSVQKKRHRRRAFTSCVRCRRRKVKCDRKHPCTRCIRAGMRCEYTLKGETSNASRECHSTEGYSTRQESHTAKESVIPTESHLKPLLDRVKMLEREVESLKSGIRVKHSVIVSDPLNRALPSMKQSLIISNKIGTNYLGPTCRMWFFATMPAILDYLGELLALKGKEKQHWLETHPSWRAEVGPLNTEPGDSVSFVLAAATANLPAFEERVFYFQRYLNPLVFHGCIPMDLVHSLLFKYFRCSNRDWGTEDSQDFFYLRCGDLALVTAVVCTTCMFTRLDNSTQPMFAYELPCKASELFAAFVRLLNAAHFSAHPTHVSLLSLLILCESSLLCKGSADTHCEIDSYPIFQLCVSTCLQMGIHLDVDTACPLILAQGSQDERRYVSQHFQTAIWNFILREDAFYSVMIGTPLLLNDYTCHDSTKSSISTFCATSVHIEREVATALNSTAPVSVSIILKLITRVSNFCRHLPSLLQHSHARGTPEMNLDMLAFTVRQKLVCLQLLQRLYLMVMEGISVLVSDHSDEWDKISDTGRNRLERLSACMSLKCLMAVVASLYIVKAIVAGQTVFEVRNNGRYMMYFRDMITTVLGHCTTAWFTYVLPEASGSTEWQKHILETRRYASNGVSKRDEIRNNGDEITLELVENALFSRINHGQEDIGDYVEDKVENETGKKEKQEKAQHQQELQLGKDLFLRLSRLQEMLKFADDTFVSNKVIRSSFESFLTARSAAFWIYVLRTVEECRKLLLTKQITVLDIMEKMRIRLIREFDANPPGKVDNTLNSNEGDSLDGILDNVLNASNEQYFGDIDLLDPDNLFSTDDELLKAYQNI